jgi:8-oxo-dGTP diphosphatase
MPNTGVNNYIHVVAGIIRDPDNPHKILITRRKKGQHLENLWEFPGGKTEPGESRFQALRRELLEEVGIHVVSALPFQAVYHRYPDKHIYLDVWEIQRFKGVAQGAENQQVKWIALKDFKKFDFPAADEPVLKALGLGGHVLITPDVIEGQHEAFINQFERTLRGFNYAQVVFRSHHLDDDSYLEIATELQSICNRSGSQVIIHRPTLVSLKSDKFDQFSCRHLNSQILQSLASNPFGSELSLSASCHDVAELRMAERLGCQFAFLSTVRDTQSHPGRKPKGWLKLKSMIDKSGLPVYALGGVNRKDFCAARYQGAVGVAGISDFWSVY